LRRRSFRRPLFRLSALTCKLHLVFTRVLSGAQFYRSGMKSF
jgi:hypothetical protein